MKQTRNEDKVKARLLSDYQLLVESGYNVLGVFLQGSQNYNLDYEESDIDTKAIVLPTLRDIVLNREPVSTTHVLPTNEHVDIKDIRLMFNCFKKQNINFLEILFTKYRYINPEYEALYFPMLEKREMIAHYNTAKALATMVGMMLEKRKALCHPYPAMADRIAKYGFDRKQLHHIIRLEEFINRYLSGESYEACLISKQAEYLLKIKSDSTFINKEQAEIMADEAVARIRQVEANFKAEHDKDIQSNVQVEALMESVLFSIISYSIGKELSLS